LIVCVLLLLTVPFSIQHAVYFLSLPIRINIFSSFSYLYGPRSIFFRHFLICMDPDQYFSVNFLSVPIQINIFLSISYLYRYRLIFFRQFVICTAADQYFSVKLLSASMQVDILPFIIPSNFKLKSNAFERDSRFSQRQYTKIRQKQRTVFVLLF